MKKFRHATGFVPLGHIFLAESKALGLSEGDCLPKPAILKSCSRTAASFLASNYASKSAFSCSAFNSDSSNS